VLFQMQPVTTSLCTFHRNAVIAFSAAARPDCTLGTELCTAYVMIHHVLLLSNKDIYIYIFFFSSL